MSFYALQLRRFHEGGSIANVAIAVCHAEVVDSLNAFYVSDCQHLNRALATGTPTRALDGKLALGHGTDATEFVSFMEGLPGLLRDLEAELEAQAQAQAVTTRGDSLSRSARSLACPALPRAPPSRASPRARREGWRTVRESTGTVTHTGIVGRRWQRGAARSFASAHSLACPPRCHARRPDQHDGRDKGQKRKGHFAKRT